MLAYYTEHGRCRICGAKNDAKHRGIAFKFHHSNERPQLVLCGVHWNLLRELFTVLGPVTVTARREER